MTGRVETIARIIARDALILRSEGAGVPCDGEMAQRVVGVAVDYLWHEYVVTANEILEALGMGDDDESR